MEDKRFTLRMDGELFQDISELAVLHRRSTAKEIECAIAAYVQRIKESQIIDEYGMEPTSEQAREEVKKLRQLREKYKAYE